MIPATRIGECPKCHAGIFQAQFGIVTTCKCDRGKPAEKAVYRGVPNAKEMGHRPFKTA